MIAMYIDIVPNRKSRPAILLRESVREGKKIRKVTLANLSSLSIEQAQDIRRILKGETMAPASDLFEIEKSLHHGHVQAVMHAMKRLNFRSLIGSRPSEERELVIAMVAARIIEPDSKLATTRWWSTTTLPELCGVEGAGEDDLYAALDWLAGRQEAIEKKLAARHLGQGGQMLYDLSSSYFEGRTCPLAARGYSRDKRKDRLQVNYGLLTDSRGCPVSVSVFKGNVADPDTLVPQMEKIQRQFGISHMVLVGDRGMITQKHINSLKDNPDIDWVTAMKSGAIGSLMNQGAIQLGLFDERDLFELQHPDFPGERLVACRNPDLAYHRVQKRNNLIDATCKQLEKIQGLVERGRLKGKDKIGVRVGKIINKYKMGKHFILEIEDDDFRYHINEKKIRDESALDGVYIIRTSLKECDASTEGAVEIYKGLSRVERAFRCMKSIDIQVRPIYHRLEQRVRAHIFLCMLAYYVKWHMLQVWAPLLFADEKKPAPPRANPVQPARRSASALRKVLTKQTSDGATVHSFRTLMHLLSTIVRNTCRRRNGDPGEAVFTLDTRPTPHQQSALDMLEAISP